MEALLSGISRIFKPGQEKTRFFMPCYLQEGKNRRAGKARDGRVHECINSAAE
jgi:hypothetical protein